MPIKLLLVDDHALVQEGLVAVLGLDPDIEVIGTASDGQQALEKLAELTPDIVVMDIRMPNLHGIDATARIAQEFPGVKVIILSMHDNCNYIVNAMKAGARGYLLKNSSTPELINAIKQVHAGGRYLSPEVSSSLLDDLTPTDEPVQAISKREQEVLIWVTKGLTNKEIARQLDISVRTVEVHRLNLKRKLGIDTSAGLVRYALEQGLIQDEL